MNIAILVSGLPRNVKNSYSWLKTSILDVLTENEYNYDIFISTWWDIKETQEFFDTYKPVEAETEEWNDEMANQLGWQEFKNQNYELQAKSNTLAMFYKIWKCNELRKEYEKTHNKQYSGIIRARTELRFNNKIDTKELEILDKHQDKPIIFLRRGPNPNHFFWYKDNFSIMNRAGADIYCDCFNQCINISKITKITTPELILRNWLYLNNLNIQHTSLDYTLTRE